MLGRSWYSKEYQGLMVAIQSPLHVIVDPEPEATAEVIPPHGTLRQQKLSEENVPVAVAGASV